MFLKESSCGKTAPPKIIYLTCSEGNLFWGRWVGALRGFEDMMESIFDPNGYFREDFNFNLDCLPQTTRLPPRGTW
jgi:hypothetical protein